MILLSILLHLLVLEKLYFQSGFFLVSHFLAHTHVNNMPQPFLNLFLCPYLLFVSRYRTIPTSPRAVLEYFLLVYGFRYIFFNFISRVQNALFRKPRVTLLSNPNILIYLFIIYLFIYLYLNKSQHSCSWASDIAALLFIEKRCIDSI